LSGLANALKRNNALSSSDEDEIDPET
jgi:hypothetical protein